MSRKAKIIIYSACALVFLGMAAIFIKVRLDLKALLADGIRTEASVLDLAYESRGKRRSKDYYMTAGVFFDNRPAAPAAPAPAPANAGIDAKLDAIFAKVAADRHLGDFDRITLKVSAETYNKYKRGDRVKVVYLRGDPESARVLEEIE
jgi:hypothetical protein